jgi:triosephosphate isomerase
MRDNLCAQGLCCLSIRIFAAKPNAMREKIVAGNWKMNTTLAEAIALTTALRDQLNEDDTAKMIICPPFPWLVPVRTALTDVAISIGAQNCSEQRKGAFTGEVSASMLESAGAEYVILGHSERRALYGETDALIALKVRAALENGLQAIFCCGETLEEREAGKLEEVLSRQVSGALEGLNETDMAHVIVAYEPVWAIGTGVTASPEQAQEVHAFLRGLLKDVFSETVANNMSILYGGSCNAQNAASLFSQADIDGGLIGGASLNAADFLTIARSF